MKSLLRLVISAVVLLGVSDGLQAFAADGAHSNKRVVRKRQHREEKRIKQGVKSGELTPEEAAELQKEQHAIRKQKREALKNDGKLDAEERKDLKESQDAASKNIYEEKHDSEAVPQATPTP